MKRLVLIGLLFATPSMAQQTPQPSQQAEAQALHIVASDAIARETYATAMALDLRNQVNALQQQLTAVTAERDKLKAEATKKPEPPKAP